ncbi:hypothetical protein CRG98_012222 [Punica granatum]|uniref:Uncharacterized protein n=1 Tax=Punica granatum TaxID=22663 RepID=A0A2I0KFV7_PUNGR|nr:hypothetical protein CRG98_012222 [Punica granatum]
MERNVSDQDRICPSYVMGVISHGRLVGRVYKSLTASTADLEVPSRKSVWIPVEASRVGRLVDGLKDFRPRETSTLDVPFPSTTLASRAITFEGFLTTPTLPREEAVTVRPGLGTFGTIHERLNPSLRSPRSPILHRAVAGASVLTPFSPSCLTGILRP